ncbi:ABC transporter permease [Actinocorallia longicatena]
MTFRGMLGRRRVIMLFLLPAMLLALSVLLKATVTTNMLDVEVAVLQRFALATLLPLLALIAGTGVIGPEIDDGQIMYVLTKPISRTSVIVTKYVCAVVLVTGFAVIPTVLSAVILGENSELPGAFGIGVFVGGVAYSAIFVALGVISRHAVTIGLIYAMVWESLVGNFAPGAKTLSVQQWALRITDEFTTTQSINPDIGLATAVILLIVVTVGSMLLATVRLRSLTIASAE